MEATPTLLQRPVTSALWTLAWPVIALGFLRSAFFLGDAWWVGHLGSAALEGLSGASFATWILHSWGDLGMVGILSLVARAAGAQNQERIRTLIGQGFMLSLCLGLLAAAGSFFLPSLYFNFVGFSHAELATARQEGIAYLTPLVLGTPFLMVHLLVHAVFRGLGNTRTPMLIMAASLVLNLVLDPLLLFGVGPFPKLGVAGAAWATIIANGIAAVIGMSLLTRSNLFRFHPTIDIRLWYQILVISAPIAFAGMGFCAVYVFLGPIVTAFGRGTMAALGVGHRVESLAYFYAYGVGQATATLVGQYLGASRPEGAWEAVRAAERLSLVVLGPLAILFLFGAPLIFSIFTDDPAFIQAGCGYLRWAALALVFMGWEMIYEEAFAGAGDTLPPTRIVLPLTVLRIPLAWVLANYTPLGLHGVWVAIALSTLSKGVFLRLSFARGGWAKRLGTLG